MLFILTLHVNISKLQTHRLPGASGPLSFRQGGIKLDKGKMVLFSKKIGLVRLNRRDRIS